MTIEDDLDIPSTGAVFTFGKSRFADNAPSKFWIKNDNITDVVCGDEHTAILTGTGRLFMIGSNDLGQLGLDSYKPVAKPSCVKALKPHRAVRVACGRAHTLAACEDGGVFGWGHNEEGQLGTGDKEDRPSPHLLMGLQTPPRELGAGSAHSALVTAEGELLVWGSNTEGQLGLEAQDQLTPVPLPLGERVVSVACGYYHTLALTESGSVVVWGEAEHGQLGLPEQRRQYRRTPQTLTGLPRAVQLAAGSRHSLVLTEEGVVLSCGKGSYGQLGQGAAVDSSFELRPVLAPDDVTFVAVAAGDTHSAALASNGHVYTWGCGRHGKLGLGENNLSPQFVPVPISRLRHLTAHLVGCGGCHTMVLGYPSSAVTPASLDDRAAGLKMLPPLRGAGPLPPLRPSVAAAPSTPEIPHQEERPYDQDLDTDIDQEDNVEDNAPRLAAQGDDESCPLDSEETGQNQKEPKDCEDDDKKEGDVPDDGLTEVKGKKLNPIVRLLTHWGRRKTSSIEVIDEVPHEIEHEQADDPEANDGRESKGEKHNVDEEEDVDVLEASEVVRYCKPTPEEVAEASMQLPAEEPQVQGGLVHKLRHLRKVNNITDGQLEEAHPPDDASAAPVVTVDPPSSPARIGSTQSRACIIL